MSPTEILTAKQPEAELPAQEESKPEECKDALNEKEISRLVAELGSDFLTEREEAVKRLVELKGTAVPDLFAALGSDDFRVRACAAQALGFIGKEDTAPELVKLLKDSDSSVRQEARKALAQIGPAAIKCITEAMKEAPDGEKKQLEAAVLLLVEKILQGLVPKDIIFGAYPGHVEPVVRIGPVAIPALKRLAVESDRPNVRSLAVDALGELGDKSVVPFLEELHETRGAIWYDTPVALYRLGKDRYANALILEYCRRILDSPQDGRAHYELAILYHRLGKLNEAEAEYKEAIQLNASIPFSSYNLACVLARLNKKEEAIETFKKAAKEGVPPLEYIMRDKGLDNIRNEEEFKAIMKEKFGEQKPNR
jgi:tetratricopeptide (TPR) repeat protein